MYKQAIVIRNDLKMGKGKLAAQASHASVSAFIKTQAKDKSLASAWLSEGQKKITLKVNSEEELLSLSKIPRNTSLLKQFLRGIKIAKLELKELLMSHWESSAIFPPGTILITSL